MVFLRFFDQIMKANTITSITAPFKTTSIRSFLFAIVFIFSILLSFGFVSVVTNP